MKSQPKSKAPKAPKEPKEKEPKAPKEPKEKEPKAPNPFTTVRGSWIVFLLYPDNCHHMDILSYLKDIGSTMCWIEHEPEEDEKKKHIHVMIHFDRARTASGFCSSFGKGWYSVTKEDDKEVFTPIPFGQESIFISAGNAVEKDILSYAEVVSSPCDKYRYFTHSDFKSMRSGKKRYSQDAVQKWGDINLIDKLAYQEYQNFENTISDLMFYSDRCFTANELMRKLLSEGRYDLVSYIQSRAYFVREFMLKSYEKKDDKKGG